MIYQQRYSALILWLKGALQIHKQLPLLLFIYLFIYLFIDLLLLL